MKLTHLLVALFTASSFAKGPPRPVPENLRGLYPSRELARRTPASTEGRALALDSQGNLLVTGSARLFDKDHGVIVKLSGEGRLLGQSTHIWGGRTGLTNVFASGDKIVVSGFWANLSPLLLRLNADLSLDTTFGGGDGMIQDECSYGDWTSSHPFHGGVITVRTSGASNVPRELRRYTSTGTFDTRYGLSGLTTLGSNRLTFWPAIHQDSSRAIFIYGGNDAYGGQKEAHEEIVKINSSGKPDSSFGNHGVVNLEGGCVTDWGARLAQLSENRLLLVNTTCQVVRTLDASGAVLSTGGYEIFSGLEPTFVRSLGDSVAVLDSHGKILLLSSKDLKPITSFGTGGVATISDPEFQPISIVQGKDGTLFIAGSFVKKNEEETALGVIALATNGAPIESFALKGIYKHSITTPRTP